MNGDAAMGIARPSKLADARAALPPSLRALHREILRAFLVAGVAPSEAWLRDQAVHLDLDPDAAQARLARADLVHTGEGIVAVAYPFSGTPTPHEVRIVDGPSVWAMCAVDALGIPLMTGRDGIISSAAPDGGEPIRVERRGESWIWEPDSAVVLFASSSGCSSSAECQCPQVNFHLSVEGAEAHLRAHPGVTGVVLSQPAAVERAETVFGSLLRL